MNMCAHTAHAAHYLTYAAQYLNKQIVIVIWISADFLSVVSLNKIFIKKSRIKKAIVKKFLIKKIIIKSLRKNVIKKLL